MGVGSSLLFPSRSSRSNKRFCSSLQALTCLLPVAITVRVTLPPSAPGRASHALVPALGPSQEDLAHPGGYLQGQLLQLPQPGQGVQEAHEQQEMPDHFQVCPLGWADSVPAGHRSSWGRTTDPCASPRCSRALIHELSFQNAHTDMSAAAALRPGARLRIDYLAFDWSLL